MNVRESAKERYGVKERRRVAFGKFSGKERGGCGDEKCRIPCNRPEEAGKRCSRLNGETKRSALRLYLDESHSYFILLLPRTSVKFSQPKHISFLYARFGRARSPSENLTPYHFSSNPSGQTNFTKSGGLTI